MATTKVEEDERHEALNTSSPTTSLLAATDPSSPPKSSSIRLLLTCSFMSLAIAVTLTLAFFLFSHISTSPSARPLTTLSHPVVLLISSDGFRFGYQFKTPSPNIHHLMANGTEAETGLIPLFSTLTFPNHYSIVTGLYPPYHGIINNFSFDPYSNDKFTMSSHEPKWWLGEPLWKTVVDHDLRVATYFWPGSEVHKGSWICPSFYCRHYNGSVPFEERVDAILDYFDLPPQKIPSFLTLYFEDPDH